MAKRKSKKAGISVTAIILAVIIYGLNLYMGEEAVPTSTNADFAGPYKVVKVSDGDTITVDMDGTNEKIRLIGIDTPESVHPDPSKNVPYGKVASDYTKGRLLDEYVELEYDAEERDRYGRVLAYVYLDGQMYNLELVEKGHAKVATYPPNVKYVETFTAAQKKAREEGKGLWSQ